MKRSAALLTLSREHHTALVLSLRIAKATSQAMIDEIVISLPTIFNDELEPHFQTEEKILLPQLEAVGQVDLVRRTLDEHRLLRQLAKQIESGDLACLAEFGAALAGHVRFEERELFVTAEAVLPKAYLEATGTASLVSTERQA